MLEVLHTLDEWKRPVAYPAHAKFGKPGDQRRRIHHHDVDRQLGGRAERPNQPLVNEARREESGRTSLLVGSRPFDSWIEKRRVSVGSLCLKEKIRAGVDKDVDR